MCEEGYQLDDDERSCTRVKSLCDLKELRLIRLFIELGQNLFKLGLESLCSFKINTK